MADRNLARVYAEMQHSIASAERIFKLVDTPSDVHDKAQAVPAETLLGEIEFEHVNFYYEARKPVLSDFTLKVQPGEMIKALVGPTGGGKSTIVNLLCRFYEPTEGLIRINGRDYTDYALASIHSRIGIVLQTPHLFSGSVRDNIRYGRLEAQQRGGRGSCKGRRGARLYRHPRKGLRPERRRGRQPALGGAEAAYQPGTRRPGPAGVVHHG